MTDSVPFLDFKAAHAELEEELNDAYHRVMRSGWYILGDEVRAFESEWAEYCGTKHCVGVGNGLNGLELVLRAWGIGAGDEVIVPSNTYIATWLAVTNVGATCVPVEPEAATSNIDPNLVEAAITPATKAVLPVHLYGRCADAGKILQLARERGIRVLEDAAQAHGATYGGHRAGSLGDAAAFSFYPTKNLGGYGDGGAVTTDDDDLAEAVRLLGNYGSRTKYVNEIRGTNSRLDELQAALLRVRLKHLDDWNSRRVATAEVYTRSLADLRGMRTPSNDAGSAWHVYVVHHDDRDELQRRLAAQGVETLIFYPVPPHLSEAYRDYGWAAGTFPIAERLASSNLALPIGPHLTDGQQTQVVSAVRNAAEALAGP